MRRNEGVMGEKEVLDPCRRSDKGEVEESRKTGRRGYKGAYCQCFEYQKEYALTPKEPYFEFYAAL
jgi:hypothetical protein